MKARLSSGRICVLWFWHEPRDEREERNGKVWFQRVLDD